MIEELPAQTDPTMATPVDVAGHMDGPPPGLEASLEARVLSPEAIAGIESMDAPATTKVNYLLVALGEKPSAWEHIQTPGEMDTMQDEPPPVMPDETRQTHLKVARDAGVAVIEGRQSTMGRVGGKHATTLELFLGSSQENAEHLRDAALAGDSGVHALGIALGYPETAVDAFVDQHAASMVSAWEVPAIDPDVKVFAGFKLSTEHYSEELETARRWAEAVKAASPTIYAQRLAHTDWIKGLGPNPYE